MPATNGDELAKEQRQEALRTFNARNKILGKIFEKVSVSPELISERAAFESYMKSVRDGPADENGAPPKLTLEGFKRYREKDETSKENLDPETTENFNNLIGILNSNDVDKLNNLDAEIGHVLDSKTGTAFDIALLFMYLLDEGKKEHLLRAVVKKMNGAPDEELKVAPASELEAGRASVSSVGTGVGVGGVPEHVQEHGQ